MAEGWGPPIGPWVRMPQSTRQVLDGQTDPSKEVLGAPVGSLAVPGNDEDLTNEERWNIIWAVSQSAKWKSSGYGRAKTNARERERERERVCVSHPVRRGLTMLAGELGTL